MSVGQNPGAEMSFWDHLDVLRGTIFRSAVAVLAFGVIAFCFKEFLFERIILAPIHGDFPTYRIMGVPFEMKLINIEISTQFMVHVRMACATGLVVSCPYILYEIWRFIAPALFKKEKKAVSKAFLMSSGLFYLGVLVGYFLVLPLCLNFFVDYTVSDQVVNNITLTSYISLFMSLVIVIGLVFEFPMVVMALSIIGLLDRSMMRKGRKLAIVIVLSVSAIITPADPMSMIILAIPLYALFEFSILMCRKAPVCSEDDEEEEEEEEKEEEEEEGGR